MAGEVRDNSPVCKTCGRYLTVLGCTAERCARPTGEVEMAANAALIAAAPEMLEVLRQAAAEVLPHEYGDLAEKAQAILDRLRGAGAIT